MVAGVFHSVAAKYDLMNDLMSFGIPPAVETIRHRTVPASDPRRR
jgi:ubiquinone/menaquinone biosynthesis C-methylase UbiE